MAEFCFGLTCVCICLFGTAWLVYVLTLKLDHLNEQIKSTLKKLDEVSDHLMDTHKMIEDLKKDILAHRTEPLPSGAKEDHTETKPLAERYPDVSA